ncbi:MAG: alanine racemase, partial [Actinobacteria bacterium]|nr:alanine racemase [Actinomycetota bacterium]
MTGFPSSESSSSEFAATEFAATEFATVEIDLAAIAENTRALAARASGAAVMAVVKADGFDHGADVPERLMRLGRDA